MIHLLDFYPSQGLEKRMLNKKTRVEQRALSWVILFKVLVAKDQKILFWVGEGRGRQAGRQARWWLSATWLW